MLLRNYQNYLKKLNIVIKILKRDQKILYQEKEVELLFEKKITDSKTFELEILTKFIRAYLRFYLTQGDTSQSKLLKSLENTVKNFYKIN